MSRFGTIALVGAAGLVALSGCAHAAAASGDATTGPVTVRVGAVRHGTLTTPVDVAGSLSAVRQATVGVASAGRIVSVDVRVGDAVRAGQTLAQVDASAYAAGVAEARAGSQAADATRDADASSVVTAASAAAGARAQLGAAEAHARLAATTDARMSQLLDEGAISKQQHDESVADLAAATAAVAQARAAVAGSTASLAAARAQLRAASATQAQARAGVDAASVPLADATVVAPFDGVVVAKFVDPGAVVGAGSPVVAIEDARDLEIDVAVPDDRVAALAPEMPVDVRVDAVGADVTGRVRAVVPSQNAALRSATVKIDVPADPALQPGMYARVSFASRSREGWTAPLAALVTRAGQSGIFVVRDGRVSFVPVDPGATGASSVELLEYRGGVAEAAVSQTQRLDDGSAVRVAR